MLNPVWIWSEDYAPEGETNARFRFERRFTALLTGLMGNDECRMENNRSMERGAPSGRDARATVGPRWVIEISADSRYRLWINGRRVADGPARGYPNAPFFDRVEVGAFLRDEGGENVLAVEVTHFGVDTFQYMRGAPGLWLRLRDERGEVVLVSDGSWSVRRVAGHRVNVPRISPQLGFEEHFDASAVEAPARPASRQWRRDELPQARDVAEPGNVRKELERTVLMDRIREWPSGQAWTFHVREHLGSFPGSINMHGLAGVLASEFHVADIKEAGCEIEFCVIGLVRELRVDGRVVPVAEVDQDLRRHVVKVGPGVHGASISICDRYDHVPELSVAWRVAPDPEVRSREVRGQRPESGVQSPEVHWRSPWVSSGALWRGARDSHCPVRADGSLDAQVDTFERTRAEVAARVDALARQMSKAEYGREKGAHALERIFIAEADAYLAVRLDEVVATDAGRMPTVPAGETPAPHHGPNACVALPAGSRLLLDLENLTNGFFEMDIEVGENDTGTVIDAYFFENYQSGDLADGQGPAIQFMQNDGNPYRTSFRYVARAGRQVFLSLQRRGFRYVLLTVRGKTPDAVVTLHSASVIESLYPADPARKAEFHSSDPRLDAIFKMSQHTLHLCMEDTFTDCPSYEQTLWVGDARHEALFAAVTFGAYDLAERCARLVADSHRHMNMPMAACQCPSGWDAVLPSFSFLWVISVSEIHLHTGSDSFLSEMFPAIRRTLDTAILLCTDHGLFSAPMWNFFEWAPIDQGHNTVLHNSILLAGALDAGARMAERLGTKSDDFSGDARCFSEAREKLVSAIGRLWRPDEGVFSDALVNADGGHGRNAGIASRLSPKTSQHTSFLALLFDALPFPAAREAALRNCLAPPKGMTTVGSPFAMFFLLEVLLCEHFPERVLEEIRAFWGRILDAGSKTCWEMVFPDGARFPTRSHCHGWSAGPVYLLPFLFFGIEILEPGWRRIRLSPRALGVTRIDATVNTPHGLLRLHQHTDSGGKLVFSYQAPPDVSVKVTPVPLSRSQEEPVDAGSERPRFFTV